MADRKLVLLCAAVGGGRGGAGLGADRRGGAGGGAAPAGAAGPAAEPRRWRPIPSASGGQAGGLPGRGRGAGAGAGGLPEPACPRRTPPPCGRGSRWRTRRSWPGGWRTFPAEGGCPKGIQPCHRQGENCNDTVTASSSKRMNSAPGCGTIGSKEREDGISVFQRQHPGHRPGAEHRLLPGGPGLTETACRRSADGSTAAALLTERDAGDRLELCWQRDGCTPTTSVRARGGWRSPPTTTRAPGRCTAA